LYEKTKEIKKEKMNRKWNKKEIERK